MGIYDRQYYRDEPQGFSLESITRGHSMVTMLIAINVAVLILDAVLPQSHGRGVVNEFLKLSTSDLSQPWYWFRFLTYGFAHDGPRHIIGNMIGLFFFGRVAESVYGSRKFLWMYLTAIIAGSIVWLLSERLAGGTSSVVGASGGVVAVVLLFCINFPQQKVYLLFLPFVGIPAWVLGLVYVGGDLLGWFGNPHSNVAFTVHLTGALYAYFFYKTQWDIGELVPSGSGARSFSNPFKSKPKLRVHRPDDAKHEKLEAKADEVLQKLHQQGESSLTARERKILEEYSRSIKQKNQ